MSRVHKAVSKSWWVDSAPGGTGHARKELRIMSVMLNDAQQPRLMLTNGSSQSNFECTMFFDGSAIDNPGDVGGCG